MVSINLKKSFFEYTFSNRHLAALNPEETIGRKHRHLRIYRLLNSTYHLPCLLY
jgi:hypothetical protein